MEKEIKKYYSFLFIIILLVISFFIIKSFLSIILSSFILAFILLPFHKKLSSKISPSLSAFLLNFFCAILLLFLILFSFFSIYKQTKDFISGDEINKWIIFIQSKLVDNGLEGVIKEKLISFGGDLLSFLLKQIYSLIESLISLSFSIFLIFFLCYFILLNWNSLMNHIYNLVPLDNKKKIFEKISSYAKGLLYSYLFIAFLEFFISLIFFSLIGEKYSFFLSFLIAITAFVPFVGPSFVWVPLSLLKLLAGNYSLAFLIFIFGIFLGIFIDEILRAKISSRYSEINSAIVLLGILGGVKLFGIFGMLIGPIALMISLTILENVSDNKSEQN
ncbi:MAG: AI-2E family transporter [Candidatus Pacearchaeota archaeon]